MNIKNFKKYTAIAFSPWLEGLLEDLAHLVLRVSVSILIMTHGWGKLSNFAVKAESFPDPIGLGPQLSLVLTIGAEFFAAIFIIFGLFTRLASLSLVVLMTVIVFVFHGDDPFKSKELGLLYGIVFLSLMISGSRKWSLDDFLHRRLK